MNIAIFTTFNEFHAGYSLTGIVLDQCEMLTRYGHQVKLFVNEKYSDKNWPIELPEGVELVQRTPFAHLKDYTTMEDITDDHIKAASAFTHLLIEALKGADICITHDFIFTGWNYPYCLGLLQAVEETRHVLFLHWVHSVPTGMRDWWEIQRLRPNHKIVYPNETDRLWVAEQFRGTIDDVRVVPHIKDMRTWFDFHEDTRAFLDEYPLMNKDIIQIYPASSDRLEAKRLDWLIHLFGIIKERGHTVALVCANQWASPGRKITITDPETYQKTTEDALGHYEKIAWRNGLRVGEDFIFTSRFQEPKFQQGLPKRMLRELMLLSNIFAFPTDHESFGLVLPEVILTGAPYPVLNKSLDMMKEVGGLRGLYVDMGSYNRQFQPADGREYLKGVAEIIIGRMVQNESLTAKMFMRKAYNFDTIYHRYIEPIFGERRLLTKQPRVLQKV